LEIGPAIKHAQRNDGERKDPCVGFEMAADGLFVVGDGDVSVHSAVEDVAVHIQKVDWSVFFNKGVARRKTGVVDDVEVIPAQRADAGKNDGVFDVLFLDGLLKTLKDVCAGFEPNDNDSGEIACGRLHGRAGHKRVILIWFGRLYRLTAGCRQQN
jgi:hypothetical protein